MDSRLKNISNETYESQLDSLLTNNDTELGEDNVMVLVAFITCLSILLLSLMGVIGVIVLYYRMERRTRDLKAAKSVAISFINVENQHRV